MNSNPAPVFLLVLAFALSAPAAEPAPGRYTSVSASPDGIGKVYAGREIARVMSFHGTTTQQLSDSPLPGSACAPL